MKTTFFSLITAFTVAAVPIHNADTPHSRTPVLLELFTSEGCSSCSPMLSGFLERPFWMCASSAILEAHSISKLEQS